MCFGRTGEGRRRVAHAPPVEDGGVADADGHVGRAVGRGDDQRRADAARRTRRLQPGPVDAQLGGDLRPEPTGTPTAVAELGTERDADGDTGPPLERWGREKAPLATSVAIALPACFPDLLRAWTRRRDPSARLRRDQVRYGRAIGRAGVTRPDGDSTIVFLVLAGVVVLFVSNLVPVEIVAVGHRADPGATGVLDISQALAGFGDPAVVYIAALFVVSEALDATGVTAWAGQQLIAGPGSSSARLLVLMMLLCAALTALISVNGAVAALLPVVVVLRCSCGCRPRAADAARLRRPRRLDAALTGSPVNVIVSEAAQATPAATTSGSSSSPSSASRSWPAPWPSSSCSASGCCPTARPPHLQGLQRPRPHAAAPVRARARRGAAVQPSRPGVAEVVIPPDRDDRRAGVPRDGHRQRRPRGPRHPAQGRGPRPQGTDARRRRHPARPGHVGRPVATTSTTPMSSSSTPRGRAPSGRAVRAGRPPGR